MTKKIIFIITALLMTVGSYAKRMDPYQGSRIFWDKNSRQTLFSEGNYARIIELQDGRLLAVAERAGVTVSYSSNKGETWSGAERILAQASGYGYAVPDLIQLSDGTIIIGYNPRPNAPYSEDRKFAIRCMRSEDNGVSWSAEIPIYTAQHTFNDGCWEPSFLELPSGEVQCYFANEGEYTSSGEQCISMCRSFDKGKTWSEPVKVSFRAGSRDGMPVPILLKDKSEIVVIIEDNGWPGRGNFAATTVRTTLEDNWNSGYVAANSANRSMIFETTPAVGIISAAPYICVLPSGETVASYQGNENRGSNDLEYFDMFVEVGDDRARNFKAKSRPFALEKGKKSIWNSVAVVDTGVVIAVGSHGEPHGVNHIEIIKGYPKTCFVANYGTPVMDGTFKNDDYTYKNARQVLMGNETGNQTNADFLYDADNLYFTARVMDRTIIDNKIDNDGIYLSLDCKNACDTYPQDGMFRFFFDVNGTFTLQYGNDGKWVDASEEMKAQVEYCLVKKSFYYDVEVAIPWRMLGFDKPVTSMMRTNIEIVSRTESDIAYEIIPETLSRQSWTWMEFYLNGAEAVADVKKDARKVKTTVSQGVLNVKCSQPIESLTLTSFAGMTMYTATDCGKDCTIALPLRGGGILQVRLTDGSIVTRKLMFR